jgi:hypothetical protein
MWVSPVSCQPDSPLHDDAAACSQQLGVWQCWAALGVKGACGAFNRLASTARGSTSRLGSATPVNLDPLCPVHASYKWLSSPLLTLHTCAPPPPQAVRL